VCFAAKCNPRASHGVPWRKQCQAGWEEGERREAPALAAGISAEDGVGRAVDLVNSLV
jgi:hypothetical protein